MESKMQCEIKEEWDDILSVFSAEKRDIYFSKKYLSLYESSDHKALCAVCTDDNKIMLMPYLRGEIRGCYDFETAYGYGGPVTNTDDSEWSKGAFEQIYDHLKQNNYVCGFTRFHPLFDNQKLIRENDRSSRYIDVIYDRQTIAINTSQSIEDIWMKQISSKNRNMIRKAEKNKLEYKSEYDFDSYNDFISLYRSTMQRLSADEFYFFDDRYFDDLKIKLSDNSFLGTIRKDGKLICAAIFLFSELYGHYHLEGSDREYSGLGANNLLLWKAACEMHDRGVKEFHLGGGTTSSPEDSLYKFKKAFSMNEKKFCICKEIFDKNKYIKICREWEDNNRKKAEIYSNRLLKYRY